MFFLSRTVAWVGVTDSILLIVYQCIITDANAATHTPDVQASQSIMQATVSLLSLLSLTYLSSDELQPDHLPIQHSHAIL